MFKTTVTSLRELEDFIGAKFAGVNACFRGQSSAAWDLIPSAYRPLIPFATQLNFDQGTAAEIERDTYREFEMEAGNALNADLDIFERLGVAQHHGVPTRLLDWTSRLYVAAYFAVFGADHGDAAVWGLNLSLFPFPLTLGRQHRGGGYTLEKIKQYGRGVVASFAQPVSQAGSLYSSAPAAPPAPSPDGTLVVWKPKRVDERLSRQDGLLSWYHSFEDDDLVWNYSTHIATLEQQAGLDLLAKITIPSDKRSVFQHELLKRGVNEHFLFADLDGLAACRT